MKKEFETQLEEKAEELEELYYKDIENKEALDVSLEFPSKERGHKHPISIATELLEEIFISLGFKIEDGPQ